MTAETDGSLSVQCPREVADAFQFKDLDAEENVSGKLGKWRLQGNSVQGERVDGFAYASIPCLKNSFALKGVFSFQAGTRSFGLLVRTSADFSSGYMLGFERAGVQPFSKGRRFTAARRVPGVSNTWQADTFPCIR
ncbi:MAG: hypothetical protein QXI42_12135 [Thermoproteota archaeon]|nr:hypothetical protein [Candidatus Brockarchaeota archaeon]